MHVTQLEADARSGGVRVQLDGRPFGTVALQDISAMSLAEGRELSESAATELARRAEAFSARQVAMRILRTRALPAAELARRLVRRGHAKPIVETTVTGLREAGFVDDADFARHYVRTRAQRQRFGPRRLLGDLRRLGVTEKIAQAALTDVMAADGVDPRAVLREAAEKKARSLGGLDRDVALRRLRAYLLRRGFSGSEVAAVVKEALPR